MVYLRHPFARCRVALATQTQGDRLADPPVSLRSAYVRSAMGLAIVFAGIVGTASAQHRGDEITSSIHERRAYASVGQLELASCATGSADRNCADGVFGSRPAEVRLRANLPLAEGPDPSLGSTLASRQHGHSLAPRHRGIAARCRGRPGGFGLQGFVHAFVAAVLLETVHVSPLGRVATSRVAVATSIPM
jgi:hypothetical protein